MWKMYRNKKAFTIIELIVVIAVLGILVLLAMSRLSGYIERSQVTVIRHDVRVAENKMEELLSDGDEVFLNDNRESDWGNYVPEEKLIGLINENKLYEKENPGLVDKNTLEDLDLSEYKVIPESIRKDIKSKLPGDFYADAGGKVYYERNKAGKEDNPSNEVDKCLSLYEITNQDEIDKLMSNEYISLVDGLPPTNTVSDLMDNMTMMNAEIKFYNYNITTNYLKAKIIHPESGQELHIVFDLKDNTKIYMGDTAGNSENTLDINSDCLDKLLDIEPVEFDGEMFTYSYDESKKEATITGFTDSYVSISPGATTKGTVILPEIKINEGTKYDVVAIGDYAFSCSTDGETSKNYMNDVQIPESIINIGRGAFLRNQLQKLTIHDNVIDIGDGAFHANQLTSVNLGKGLIEIKSEVFKGNHINSIVIPNNVAKIGHDAFLNNNLENLIIPSNVTDIGDRAFGDNQLSELIIPNNVTKLGSSAFSDNKLKSLIIGNGLTELNSYVFKSNELLTVNIPNNIVVIRSHAFSNNLLNSVNLPANLQVIDESAFAYNKIKEISIPSTVTSIGKTSFVSNSLESVIFEGFNNPGLSKLNSIGIEAFYDNNLISIKIPTTVTSIGRSALQGNALKEVYMPANITGQTGIYAIIDDKFGTYYGIHKAAGLYVYTGDSPWFWTRTE